VQRQRQVNATAAVREIPLVECLHVAEMQLQRTSQPLRQKRDALAQTLAVAHGDLVVAKIDVLHTQANAFHQAQAGTIKQFSHELVLTVQLLQNGTRFAAGENYGELRRARDTLNVVHEVELAIEHVLIEKKQCAKSLILSGCGDIFVDREMRQESGDLFLAQFGGMPFAVEKNEATGPIDVSFFGPNGVMFCA
jgi:hypothetical protein